MSKLVIGAVIVLLGAGIGLYALLGGSGDKARDKTEAPVADNTGTGKPEAEPTAATNTKPIPKITTRERPETKIGYVEHVSEDGMRIRDKRGRPVANTDLERQPKLPLKAVNIDSKVVLEMNKKLKGVARKCKAEHPGDVTKGAQVQPKVAFEIKEGQLNVTEADLKLTSIDEDSEFSRCFHSGAIGLAVAASGHRDVERHRMTVPINLDRI